MEDTQDIATGSQTATPDSIVTRHRHTKSRPDRDESKNIAYSIRNSIAEDIEEGINNVIAEERRRHNTIAYPFDDDSPDETADDEDSSTTTTVEVFTADDSHYVMRVANNHA